MKIRLLRPVFKMKTDMLVDKTADFIKTPLFRRASGQKEKPQTVMVQGFISGEPGGIRTHDLLIRSQFSQAAGSLDLQGFADLKISKKPF